MQGEEMLLVAGGARPFQCAALWFMTPSASPAFVFVLYPLHLLDSVEFRELSTGTEVVFLIGAVRTVWFEALSLLSSLAWLRTN